MEKVKKSCNIGYSKKCPYELAMATMTQGMDMDIMPSWNCGLLFLREVLTKLLD
jgi:hypothetical protein